MISKNDMIYMIATHTTLMQKRILDVPLPRKVIDIIFRENKETIYQLKGDNFPESWINKYVFTSKESALQAIRSKYVNPYIN